MSSDPRPLFDRPGALWAGVAVAFSPALFAWAGALARSPYGWSLWVAPTLALLLWRRMPERGARRPIAGLALLGCGGVAELIGVAGDAASVAFAGLALAILGTALRTGVPRWEFSLLACAAIPIPTFAFLAMSPELESAVATLAAHFANALGGSFEINAPLVERGAKVLRFTPFHGGQQLAVFLAMLGYYAAWSLRKGFATAVGWAIAGALAAVPGQLVTATIGVAISGAHGQLAALLWLEHGAWMISAAVVVAGVEWRRRAT